MALLLVTGLPVFLVAVFGLSRYLEASRQEIVDDRIALAQAAALVTDGFISDTIGTAQTLALSPELTNPALRDSLSELLERARLVNRDWAQVTVLDGQGGLLAHTGTSQPDGAEVQVVLSRVLAAGRPYVGAFRAVAPNIPPRVLVGVPLTFADQSQGMLLISPSLSTLDAELRAQARGPQLQIMLVEPDGAVLLGGTGLPDTLPSTAMFLEQTDSRELNIDGLPLLVTAASVPAVNWHILALQPSALAFASLNRKVAVAVVGLIVALAVGGLAGWVLGSRLSLYYDRLVEAREQAERAAHLRDSVLDSVSHDLQNPIAAARGYLQLLRRRAERDHTMTVDSFVLGLGQIERAVLRMQAMVEELVDAARLEAGHDLTLTPTVTDLVALAGQVAEDQGSSANGHSLRIEALRATCGCPATHPA